MIQQVVVASSRCSWCTDELVNVPGMGFVHSDGVRARYREENGHLVQDHLALPVSSHPAVRALGGAP